MPSLYQFLQRCRITTADNNSNATHLSMINPTGKYHINQTDIDTFMDHYCSESFDSTFGYLESTSCHGILPVLVDADIKKEVNNPNECNALYEPNFIIKVVQVYQKVLRLLVEDIPDINLLCIVLQKDPYICRNSRSQKTYVKHGFHLHFPKLFLNKVVQEKELLPRVKLEWKKQVAINEFNINIDNILDKGYCRGTPWLMYRSRKDIEMEPYLISFVVDHEGIVQENWQTYLLDIIVPKTDGSVVDLSWENLDYYLPRIMSVSPFGKEEYIFDIKEDLPQLPTDINLQVRKMNRNVFMGEHRNEDESNMVDNLLSILADYRSVERNEWIMVGWILYNIFKGSSEGLEKWIDFSRRSPENFNLDVCQYEWSQMKLSNMTIGSLKYMAQIDNPSAYNDMIKKYMNPHILEAMKVNGSHNDTAKALFEKYEGVYVCASIKDKIWFEFRDHGWVRVEEGITLRMKISDEIVKYYENIGHEMLKKISGSDEEERPMYERKLKNCMKIISGLKSSPTKTNIMKECMEVFYNPTFATELDTNPFLFSFQNGVYDLNNHTFRDGRPSDKNSIRAPIRYRHDLTHDHPEVLQVIDFFVKIFPDKSVRDYFISMSSQVFIGGNHSKIVQVWTGEGDNGKSVTQSLFEKMLGHLLVKLPTSLLIGKRSQSSSACPELVRAGNGVRFAMVQEPDQNDTINVGILKELSGNDTFFARGLYKEGSEITPMFKFALVCNEPPKLPHNDRATWNRVRVIPFESVFSDNAPEDPDEQLLKKVFPKDPHFGEKVHSMAEAFAWYLLEHLKLNPKLGPEPDKVKMATQNYRRKNDIYRQFVDDHVVQQAGSYISVQQAYAIFKEWFREGVPNAPLPNRENFREYMVKVLGPPVKAFWRDVHITSLNPPEDLMTQESQEED